MIRSVEEADLEGRRVLVRLDLNCPLADGGVADDMRIRAVLPTLRHVLNSRAKVVAMSHLGRPGGSRVAGLSMEPVGLRLAELLDTDVVLADDSVGDSARRVVADLYGGRIALLENLRFEAGEQAGDERFASRLADLADVYVGDAFGVVHRRDASVTLVPGLMRERYAGRLVTAELASLGRLLGDVRRPYVAILGGAKISDKIKLIHNLLGRVDTLLVGGGMANTLLAARGADMGRSLVEEGSLVHARGVIEEARRKSVRLVLPLDLVTGPDPEGTEPTVVGAGDVPAGSMALDVGPATLEAFSREVEQAGTVFWNGPLGMYEKPPFDRSTVELAGVVGRSMAFSVVGGGDSAAAVRKLGLESRFDHISTGGGASLAFVGGQELPGLKALEV